ncbi:hypothetical protein RF11_12699 [Thelohanellus kitauei]|uniref:Uncharacterized protein n=1 Tax=Thelohanellus kitauei TaxID=669202 RepID=A0A0C2MHV0_THEKT|nr:hypothetical protein RF11_12699 [Thelohanellus kitauei]
MSESIQDGEELDPSVHDSQERDMDKEQNEKCEPLGFKHKRRLDMIYNYKPGKTASIYLEAKVRTVLTDIPVLRSAWNQKYQRHGKSSLINKIAWFIEKKPWNENIVAFRQIDLAEYRKTSLTTERTRIFVKSGIALIDNRGFTQINLQVINEIQRQCEGKVPPDSKVNNNWEPIIKSAFLRRILCKDCSRFEWATNCPVIVYRYVLILTTTKR